jgi:hypothetical protein
MTGGLAMSHPQQPELSRSNYGEATQDSQQIRAGERDNNADESGNAAPTPAANQTEDQRRSGSGSTVRSALED